MIPYKVDIRSILEEVGTWVDVEAPYALDRFELGAETFVLREPASIAVTISNAGAGIVVTGTITAEVTATCARCLCEFPSTISGEVEGFYLRPGIDTEAGAESDGEETGQVDADGSIDLGPALLAALVVEAPFVPLHAEECAGLCPECGADLNVGECSCHEKPDASHPFAALEALLNEPEEPAPSDD